MVRGITNMSERFNMYKDVFSNIPDDLNPIETSCFIVGRNLALDYNDSDVIDTDLIVYAFEYAAADGHGDFLIYTFCKYAKQSVLRDVEVFLVYDADDSDENICALKDAFTEISKHV